jgi:hypothetical protein
LPLSALEWSPLYSEELGIDLSAGSDREYFKWLLASVLLGGPAGEAAGRAVFDRLARHKLLGVGRILGAGPQRLARAVGHEELEQRYTAALCELCWCLRARYQGRLQELNWRAVDGPDLERRVLALPGVGPLAMNLFLRELRPYWVHADPAPLDAVRIAALSWAGDLDAYHRKSRTFARIEAGLLRCYSDQGWRRAASDCRPWELIADLPP